MMIIIIIVVVIVIVLIITLIFLYRNTEENPLLNLVYRFPAHVQNGGIDSVLHYLRNEYCTRNDREHSYVPDPFDCTKKYFCYGRQIFTATCSPGFAILWPEGRCVPIDQSHCKFYPIPPR
ncbi:hypothetical protein [Diatraea saccharalis granulovirus]|uniref:Chitin-binding type-2 domain-containing protein n=1 Tax=Diatraea saccharalis granulovirus TaxID=1675862 RepID=A0A0R7EYS5_9BBAC|nr:hypothetical protein [Diatraea saccharalis granulovirus]AKN80730.1 hypothetical protein [Diatraea saccharalis granulovirus]